MKSFLYVSVSYSHALSCLRHFIYPHIFIECIQSFVRTIHRISFQLLSSIGIWNPVKLFIRIPHLTVMAILHTLNGYMSCELLLFVLPWMVARKRRRKYNMRYKFPPRIRFSLNINRRSYQLRQKHRYLHMSLKIGVVWIGKERSFTNTDFSNTSTHGFY